jgi:hypothetical protein
MLVPPQIPQPQVSTYKTCLIAKIICKYLENQTTDLKKARMALFSHLSPVSIQKAQVRTLRRAATKAFSDSNLKANSEEMVHILRTRML